MARVPSLRASDSEREEVAERLRRATVEGRLTADELEERLEALYRSRTYGELDTLVADLPVDRVERAPDRGRVRFPKWAGAAAAITLLIAVLETLAIQARQAAVAADYRRLGFPGPFTAPRHEFVHAAPALGVLAFVGIGAVLLWLVLRPKTSSDR